MIWTRNRATLWSWSPRFQAVIVGQESGHRTSVSFMRWRTATEAAAWCARMNRITCHLRDPLTLWDYEPISRA